VGVEEVSTPFRGRQFLAITGTPAAGKSTLAAEIGAAFSVPVLSAGDVARSVDAGSRLTGAMAAEDAFREEWSRRVSEHADGPLILEGLPRKESQVDLLPVGTLVLVLLTDWPTSAVRMYSRGRLDDGFAAERYEAQLQQFGMLSGLREVGTWVTDLAGSDGVLRTDVSTPDFVSFQVLRYLAGGEAPTLPRS
jgi:broad-specificity NMP kinase